MKCKIWYIIGGHITAKVTEVLQFLLEMLAFISKKSAIMCIFQRTHTYSSFKGHKIIEIWIINSDKTPHCAWLPLLCEPGQIKLMLVFLKFTVFFQSKNHSPAKASLTRTVLLRVTGHRHNFLHGSLNNPCSRWTAYVNALLVCMFLYWY